VTVLNSANAKYNLGITMETDDVGFVSLKKYGTTLRDEVLKRARDEFDGIILGTQSHMDYPPVAEGGRNVSAGFRVGLDLYANVRPARSRNFIPNKAPGMDLVIMREATEGFYADRNMFRGIGEMMPDRDMAIAVRKITRHASMRICREAFKLALRRRQKVTAIHKANSFHMTDGLFLECFRDVAHDFPNIQTEEVIVDAFAALLVRKPESYDVVVATNFYGDILSDLVSELSGSLGLAGSINANAETGLCCAQAQHGSAPDIAGKNIANPPSLILSAAMMLNWLGEQRNEERLVSAGDAIARAVDMVIEDQSKRTSDIGGTTNTDRFAEYVARTINQL
jgi:3-isopropylmalate dehydrogenase